MHPHHAQDINGAMSEGIAMVFPLPQEEQARADLYALIARLLIAVPDASLLASLASADSISSQQADHPLDLAWEKLVLTASILDRHTIEDEFNQLFISAGNPKINPYASLYLSGFLNEKPLAALRSELAQLGLARIPGTTEMEDHLAVLCEIMRILISGGPAGRRHPVERQKLFFEKHLFSWAGRCLDDIRRVDSVHFYRQVADFALAFFSVESQAFEIESAEASANNVANLDSAAVMAGAGA